MCNLVKEENAFRLSANLKSRLLTDIRVSEISNKYQRREELIWLPKDNVCFWRYNKYVSTMYVFEDITRKHVGFRRKSGNWKWIPPGWMLLADADTESEKGIIFLLELY